jgi:DNA mismatch endonuclease (patch repair protein)
MPMANRAYWTRKIARNQERDQLNQTMLQAQGWGIYIAWECQIKSHEVWNELKTFLESMGHT